jgi:hypothetical protein
LHSALDGSELSVSSPGLFIPKERAPGTPWIGSWMDFRAVLDTAVKRKIPNSFRTKQVSKNNSLLFHYLMTKLYPIYTHAHIKNSLKINNEIKKNGGIITQ